MEDPSSRKSTRQDDAKVLLRSLRQRERDLSLFTKITKSLTTSIEFDRTLTYLMEKIGRTLRSESWSLFLMNQQTSELTLEIGKRGRGDASKSVHYRLGEGGVGWVAENGRPLLLTDISQDPRFQGGVDRISGLQIRSLLYLPIMNMKKVVGVLEWVNKKGRAAFSQQDIEEASRWVDLIAITVERSNLYQVMANLSITDDLTKLFNFRYVDQSLESELRRCRRYHSTVSVIFLDIDRFKLVNDNHGHLMGSKALIEVARLLEESLRDVDIIARYGGDEFIVVLPYTPVDMAYQITMRLQKAFHKKLFLSEDGLDLKITASFGVAGFPEHGVTKTDLIRKSDQAMYEAKHLGRDRIVVAEATAFQGS